MTRPVGSGILHVFAMCREMLKRGILRSKCWLAAGNQRVQHGAGNERTSCFLSRRASESRRQATMSSSLNIVAGDNGLIRHSMSCVHDFNPLSASNWLLLAYPLWQTTRRQSQRLFYINDARRMYSQRIAAHCLQLIIEINVFVVVKRGTTPAHGISNVLNVSIKKKYLF